ncbi:MAG: hypothetical protein FWC43_14275 [Planctomycetaceae bacterium]|nr:hypothetical protein [Planctomycetaceae bacterium]
MNYQIVKSALSSTAKLAWHVFRDGVVSVLGLREAMKISRARSHVVINELLEHQGQRMLFCLKSGLGLVSEDQFHQK